MQGGSYIKDVMQCCACHCPLCLSPLPPSPPPHSPHVCIGIRPCETVPCAGGAQARMLERLLLGSSGSLSSSGQSAGPGLAAVGRAVSTGAEGSSGPAPAPAAAAASAPVKFPFDFFEKTRCISGSARLSGDFSQTGRTSVQPLQLPTLTSESRPWLGLGECLAADIVCILQDMLEFASA